MKNKVTICGYEYKILYRDRNTRDDNNIGMSDSKDLIITIDKDVPLQQKESTLIHEWVHCVLSSNGLYTQSDDEILVSVLSTELYRSGFRV